MNICERKYYLLAYANDKNYRPQTEFAKAMFLDVSVHRGVSRPRPKGEVEGSGGCLGPDPGWRLGGLGGGVSRPRPGGVSRLRPEGVFRPRPRGPRPRGGVSQHALRQTPPRNRRLLLRTVHILLECILVYCTVFA